MELIEIGGGERCASNEDGGYYWWESQHSNDNDALEESWERLLEQEVDFDLRLRPATMSKVDIVILKLGRRPSTQVGPRQE